MGRSASRYFETAERMDEAFLELLQEKDLEFVTVKEICARANVSRSTFYLHYETMADLLEESVRLVVERLLRSFDTDVRERFCDGVATCPKDDLYLVTPKQLEPYLEFVRDNRALFSALVRNSDKMGLSEVYSLLERHVIAPILDRFDVPRSDRPYLMAFYLNGLAAVIAEWVRTDCSDSVEHVARIMQLCCKQA